MKTFTLPKKYKDSVLACGSQLKNAFCMTKGDCAYLSDHFGNLEDLASYTAYEGAVKAALKRYAVKPSVVAYDLHPEYMSSKYAASFPILKKIGVQHHHAHVASCMAEHGLDGKVIGVAFDGLGYGADGNLWGGEFLIADYSSFGRAAHLRYAPMPGGASAVREPWRMALGYIHESYGNGIAARAADFVADRRSGKTDAVIELLEKQAPMPLVSSMGRLFDGVSALIGVREAITSEGEAAIALEKCAAAGVAEAYGFDIAAGEMPWIIDWRKLFGDILRDLKRGIPRGVISAKFHNAVAALVVRVCGRIRMQNGVYKVVLSGGVFQNTYLIRNVTADLAAAGFEAYAHQSLPSNDSAIALGQAVVALAQEKVLSSTY